MARGKQVRTLSKDHIERLERFRRAPHDGASAGYSYPQLRLAMGKPCTWSTLQKALKGEPIYELICWRIREWIDRYVPAKETAPVRDGKSAAAGRESDESEFPEQSDTGHGRSQDPEKDVDGAATRRGSN